MGGGGGGGELYRRKCRSGSHISVGHLQLPHMQKGGGIKSLTAARIQKERKEPHVVVGGEHAHVECHRAHHGGARTPEQPPHAVLLDDADQCVAHALVVAPLGGGQRGVRLHADERQVRGGAHQGSQASGCQARAGLLIEGDGLQGG